MKIVPYIRSENELLSENQIKTLVFTLRNTCVHGCQTFVEIVTPLMRT